MTYAEDVERVDPKGERVEDCAMEALGAGLVRVVAPHVARADRFSPVLLRGPDAPIEEKVELVGGDGTIDRQGEAEIRRAFARARDAASRRRS